MHFALRRRQHLELSIGKLKYPFWCAHAALRLLHFMVVTGCILMPIGSMLDPRWMAPPGACSVILRCFLSCDHLCGLPHPFRLGFSHRTSQVGASGLDEHRGKYGFRPDS